MSKTILNQASISYNNKPSQSTTPVVTAVDPNISVHKYATTESGRTDNTGTIGVSRKVLYDILLTNCSSQDFTQVVITDMLLLPEGVSSEGIIYVTEESMFPNSGTLPEIQINVGTIPKHSQLLVHYTIQFPDTTPLGTTVRNLARANYYENPIVDAESGEQVPIFSNQVDLTISYTDTTIVSTKSGPEQVLCGQNFDYVLTFTNTGENTATNISITDALPDGFTVTDVEVQNGTETLRRNTDYTYTDRANPLVINSVGDAMNIAKETTLTVRISGYVECD